MKPFSIKHGQPWDDPEFDNIFDLVEARAQGHAKPTPTISMQASSWNFQFSAGMPLHPTQEVVGWGFDFPVGPDGDLLHHVNYLTTKAIPLAVGKTLSMTFEIEVTGAPIFNYSFNPNNPPGTSPAKVRLFIEETHDQGGNYQRWWANPDAFTLTATGSITLATVLDPHNWSSVLGEFGDASPAATQGFVHALQNAGKIGMTFGGGFFFGHGVNVSDGTAHMHVTDFIVF